uniref:Uncharacterized protein n=1 Tax=viral metagenome TaxID=1070528 RepID=A0A6C0L0Z4_9ZZZZ
MADLVSLLSIASCSLISIIAQIQNSRCRKIKICFGAFQCIRNVDDDDDGQRIIHMPLNNSQIN